MNTLQSNHSIVEILNSEVIKIPVMGKRNQEAESYRPLLAFIREAGQQ